MDDATRAARSKAAAKLASRARDDCTLNMLSLLRHGARMAAHVTNRPACSLLCWLHPAPLLNGDRPAARALVDAPLPG